MCSSTIAVIFLVVLNIVFFLLGAVLLVIGILLKVDPDELLNTLKSIPVLNSLSDIISSVKEHGEDLDIDDGFTNLLGNSAWVLIGVGAFLFVVGFLGVCGACKKNACFLKTYAVIVLAILLAQIAIVIYVAVAGQDIEDDISKILFRSLEDYQGFGYDGSEFKISDNPMSLAWDTFQVTLRCCGVYNYTDFDAEKAGEWRKVYNVTLIPGVDDTAVFQVPPSCCESINLNHFPNNLGDIEGNATLTCMRGVAGIHAKGCLVEVKDLINDYFYVVIGIVAGIMAVELLAILAACCLPRMSKD